MGLAVATCCLLCITPYLQPISAILYSRSATHIRYPIFAILYSRSATHIRYPLFKISYPYPLSFIQDLQDLHTASFSQHSCSICRVECSMPNSSLSRVFKFIMISWDGTRLLLSVTT